ncbi:MAG: hypothetical protein JWL87_341 [Candidatus Adlerbacteria bacterium]|nr:hypothetical protein [Candidatus Adlerbacteria bacterium]
MKSKIKKKLKRVFIVTLGVLFIIVGLLGLVLPLLQGWFFLAIGGLLLSMYSPGIRTWMDRHTIKYPKLHAFVQRAHTWTERVFGAPEVD